MQRSFILITAVVIALAAALAAAAGAGSDRPSPDFVTLVKEHNAAVVNISTTQEIRRSALPSVPEDSPLNEFFERFFGGRDGAPPAQRGHSLGSGFIISSDGLILTNAHVVQGAEEVLVRTSDRVERTAEIVGVDPRSDVALLRIDAESLPVAAIGDSSELEVGEWVLSIGSPFGLEHTATQGIVSALGRSLPSDAYVPFIQTDVAVNPGSSGGPLFNIDGEVVGINAQIFSQTGGYMGVSFAVPINVAMRVAEQLESQGHVTRGWLGVSIQPLDQELADAFGLDRPRGALISDVRPDSPAERAGLESGDIVLAYRGEPVEQVAELPLRVGQTEVGERVTLEILRDGEKRKIEVEVGQLPVPERHAASRAPAEPAPTDGTGLGLALAKLDAQQRERLGLDERGVLVTAVGPGPAAAAGIRRGDVILAVGGEPVRSGADFAAAIEEAPPGKPIRVRVQRRGQPLFVALRVPPETS